MAVGDLGIAVVGCGGIAQAHLRALTAIRGGRLVAAVDIARERAEAAVQGSGGRAYTSLGDALADPGVDACIVCLPPYLHESATVAACEAGKHVLVEKPMAMTLEESEAMVAAAEKSGVTLMVGQVLRFRSLNRKARHLLREGRIGQVVNLLRRRHSHSEAYPQAPWSTDPAKAGGWLLYGYGAHEYDMMLWLAGVHAERVYAVGQKNNPHWQDYDEVSALITLAGGIVGNVTQTLNSHAGAWDQLVIGTEGSLYVTSSALTVNGKEVEVERDTQGGMDVQLQEFVDAVRDSREPEASGRDVLVTMAALEAAKQSLASGTVEMVKRP